tara:strand:+ start:3159 stop:3692 length:534 start_codon:yes stop_codon:yes gene_type:complete
MDLSKLTSNIPDKDKSFPPVEKWNPDLCPDVAFNIDRDGNWYYQNSIIGKNNLKILFSKILKYENNNYYCVTPVEKVLVKVDIAPYMIIDYLIQDDKYLFITNLDYSFELLKDAVVELISINDHEVIPIFNVRNNIKGFLSRNVYYQLLNEVIDHNVDGNKVFILSDNQRFNIGIIE